MSQQTQNYDPRASLDYEIEPGMVFRDTRCSGDDDRRLVVEYAHTRGGVVFIDQEGDDRRDEIYMIEPHETFASWVGDGRLELVTEDDSVVYEGRYGRVRRLRDRYDEADGRTSSHKVEAIEEVLEILTDDVPEDHNDPVDFESIGGIGASAASALRSRGIRTRGDVREAGREQIESIPHMGTKNTTNLLERVDDG